MSPRRTVVVGAGLAGLTAAAYLARADTEVVVVEAAGRLGGRAVSVEEGGYRFNLGAHAHYLGGTAGAVVRDLGIAVSGGIPTPRGAKVLDDGSLRPAASWFLRHAAASRAIAALTLRRGIAGDVSLADWLTAHGVSGADHDLVRTYVRLVSFADDPARMSAGAAATQVALAARGVRYLDGGWQTLVDELTRAARGAGAVVHAGAPAAAIAHDDAVRGVRLADGTPIEAEAVVVAPGDARTAAELLACGPAGELARTWAEAAVPVRAACLDVGLRTTPPGAQKLVLGTDRPLYLSVHTRWARLAPEGGAVVHALRYLGTDAADPAEDRATLEALMDLGVPGWREVADHVRFLPQMTVASDLPTAARGGLGGRPGPAVPGVAGLALAGDWVGPSGMLADAAFASGRDAAAVVTAGGTVAALVAGQAG